MRPLFVYFDNLTEEHSIKKRKENRGCSGGSSLSMRRKGVAARGPRKASHHRLAPAGPGPCRYRCPGRGDRSCRVRKKGTSEAEQRCAVPRISCAHQVASSRARLKQQHRLTDCERFAQPRQSLRLARAARRLVREEKATHSTTSLFVHVRLTLSTRFAAT